ncbi:MAG TPA: hypothetical protein VGD37_20070 [Kofleriaceae bacterium]|jgi:hypothetical protein
MIDTTKDPGAEPDLEARIKQRRAELIGKLGELKTDVRLGTAEARDQINATLSELAHVVKWGIVDGWTSLGVPVTHKLEQWLAASARHLATRNDPRNDQS